MAVYTTINDGTAYYQGLSYAGDGSTAAKTYTGNSNMQPDLCVGRRSSASGDSWYWVDSNRGSTRRLMSDNTNSEDGYGINSFNTDGFTVNANGNQNANGYTYINFGWKANGGTTSSNSSGSITSTVQANTTSGFSIVTYTGNTTSGATIGHGLGVAPKVVITKTRAISDNWLIYHEAIGATKYLTFTTSTPGTSSGAWNNTAPSSTVVTLGSFDNGNDNDTMVAYCFAEKQGYSKFNSYSGNGNADGPFIYTGFKPAWFMIKRTDNAGNWTVFNNKSSSSNGSNLMDYSLDVNANNAQETGGTGSVNDVDFLSNGIKIRSTNGDINADGNSVLYMAFAQNPFTTSDGVPTTAR